MSDRSLSPTQIDLRPLAEAELPLEREFTPEQVMGGQTAPKGKAAADEFSLVGPVRFQGTLTRAGDRFHLRGRIGATLQLACGRCLTPFTKPVDTAVDLTYVPDHAPAGTAPKDKAHGHGHDDEVELQDEDLSTAYYHDHVLDLGEMLREQFYLALPMQPLCRPDCQGLCPTCGVDRNVERCQCHTEWVDPRLSGLKALVNRKPE